MAAGARADNCWDFVDPVLGVAFAEGCRGRSGGLVGGQIGYRWQANQWVFGLEAQGDWADLSHTRVSLLDPALSPLAPKPMASASLPARSATPGMQALLYVKGGAAVTSNRFSILDTLTGIELASASSTRWGGVVGVGFEYGFAPNWSVGLEYDHLFMGDANNSFTASRTLLPLCDQQPGQPGRGYGHLARQLPLRRLRGAVWRPATDQPLVSSKQSLSPGTVPGLFSLSANAGCWHYLAKTIKGRQRRLTQINARGRINERPSRDKPSAVGHRQAHWPGEEDIVTHVLIIVSWLGVANGAVIATQEFTSAERCDAARQALIEYAKARSSDETLRSLCIPK